MNDIVPTLRQYIQTNFLFGKEITFSDDDSFLELGIVDSTGVLELVLFVESRFQITVADEELVPENFDSINRLARFIASKGACTDRPLDEVA